MGEVYIAERTWPYEVKPPGCNKLHSCIYVPRVNAHLVGILHYLGVVLDSVVAGRSTTLPRSALFLLHSI
jgi:hypothetical protein